VNITNTGGVEPPTIASGENIVALVVIIGVIVVVIVIVVIAIGVLMVHLKKNTSLEEGRQSSGVNEKDGEGS